MSDASPADPGSPRSRSDDTGPLDADGLFDAVYAELHALARAQRRRWEGNHTMDTTALVHEAYLRLGHRSVPGWRGRAHFMAQAGRAMRHVLIDYARRRQAEKRGGDLTRMSLDEVEVGLADGRADEVSDVALLALDEALDRLAGRSARQMRIVECRFFAGLTIEETAAALDVSPATVKRGWAAAQAWLYRDLTESLGRSAT